MKTLVLVINLTIFAFGLAQETEVDTLPPPFATKSSSNFSRVIGWKEGQTPKASEGFNVTKYADGFQNPRWLYVLHNGDILVAQSNSNYSSKAT